MEIHFVSSLTADDENRFAPALLKAVGALLDQLPIAYTLRIETAGSQVFQHTNSGAAAGVADAVRPIVSGGRGSAYVNGSSGTPRG